MSGLPTSWADIELSVVAQVTSGIGFPNEYQGHTSGDLPFFKVSDISHAVLANRGELKTANHYVSHEVAEKLKGKPLAPGSTVFAKIGEAVRLNRRATVTTPCLIDNNVMAVKARDGVDDRYVHQFLRTIDFGESARSTTVPSLRKGDVEELRFPLAPAAEQKRIADKLDTVLTRVDAVNTRLARVAPLLKRFRQSVLAAATSGRLTEDWRNAQKAADWMPRTVGSLCLQISDGPFGSNLKSDDYTEEGARVVRLENIGHLSFDNTKKTFVAFDKYETLKKHTLNAGDLLFSSFVDEEVRVCEFPAGVVEPTINKADCFCVRVDETKVSRHFLMFRLACKSTYQELKELVHGATRPRINLGQLRRFELMLPSPAEQTEIVRRVETLFAFADRLEARLAQAQTAATRLTPALLAKAFRGELVPQDPNDEPAAELLRRLQTERATGAPASKTGAGRGRGRKAALAADL